MNRRDFLKASLGAAGLTALPLQLTGCAGTQIVREGTPPIDQLLEEGAKVMWVAPHPDDESMVGPILVKTGVKLGNPLLMHVLTHGDGGECCLPEGCNPDLATVRGEEMKKVAALYHAELVHDYYWNAPLPVDKFPPRHEIAHKWVAESGDPTIKIAQQIRLFQPDIVLTFSPVHGFTGHPEHQITSRFATAAVRLAADADAKLDNQPHRVGHTYFGMNYYWITRLIGSYDTMGGYTERFDIRQKCRNDMTLADLAAEFTRPHRTQDADMSSVRKLYKMLQYLYLYQTDPWNEIWDPFEPEKVES